MRSDAQIESRIVSAKSSTPPDLSIRAARIEDVRTIALAVSELLIELGGTPPARGPMEAATRALIDGEGQAGALLVGEAQGTLVGVLAASRQAAIHVPGEYLLIQDLWVAPSRRSEQIGSALICALLELAGERGIARVEVGLPRTQFAGIEATESFYRREGFTALGTRMRRVLR
jgi:GNAT superfamily N-acetyltransferase